MFFKSSNISAEILSVIELEWDKINEKAAPRPFHALSVRLKGDSTFYSDERELLQAEQGDIIFAPANLDFRKKSEHCKIIAVHFTSKDTLPRDIQCFKPRDPSLFISEFTKLFNLWGKKQLGFEHQSKMIFYRILFEIECQWAEMISDSTNDKLIGISDYIHEHFTDERLSVERLASMCGMSDTYFRRLFVSEFGTTPLKYINALRLEHAKEILRSGYYTVEAAAEHCGFNNINYFSFFIKKETGMSPLALRRSLLQIDDAPAND